MTKKNDNSSKSKNEIFDSKKAGSILSQFMVKLKSAVKAIVNRLPTKNDLRWEKLGLENSWKFIAPILIAIGVIAIIKLIPFTVYLLAILVLIITLIWVMN